MFYAPARRTLAMLPLAFTLAVAGCTGTAHTEKKLPIAKEESLSKIANSLGASHTDRLESRNPVKTLTFFGVQPGDTVLEALPGGGWYSKVLLPYLGDDGHLVGVDYAPYMWQYFGGFATEEFIAGRTQWPQTWPTEAAAWNTKGAQISAYPFASFPADMTGKVDSVLFIRALHNMARFEDKGGFLSKALAETYRVLKPGGVVGVVQHAMAEDKPDSWADGSRGYLKRSAVEKAFKEAGFEWVASTNINANPKDDPQDGDTVWRLPPSLQVPEEQKAASLAIGETNRMTLLFRKPVQ